MPPASSHREAPRTLPLVQPCRRSASPRPQFCAASCLGLRPGSLWGTPPAGALGFTHAPAAPGMQDEAPSPQKAGQHRCSRTRRRAGWGKWHRMWEAGLTCQAQGQRLQVGERWCLPTVPRSLVANPWLTPHPLLSPKMETQPLGVLGEGFRVRVQLPSLLPLTTW